MTDTAVIEIKVFGVNDDPVAQDDVGVIVEDGTLYVENADRVVSGSYDATGEHSGNIIITNSSSHKDSDADAASSLSITQIKKSVHDWSDKASREQFPGSPTACGG